MLFIGWRGREEGRRGEGVTDREGWGMKGGSRRRERERGREGGRGERTGEGGRQRERGGGGVSGGREGGREVVCREEARISSHTADNIPQVKPWNMTVSFSSCIIICAASLWIFYPPLCMCRPVSSVSAFTIRTDPFHHFILFSFFFSFFFFFFFFFFCFSHAVLTCSCPCHLLDGDEVHTTKRLWILSVSLESHGTARLKRTWFKRGLAVCLKVSMSIWVVLSVIILFLVAATVSVWSEFFPYTSFNSKIEHERRQQNTVMLKDRSTTLRTQVTTLCAILIRC